MPNELKDRPGVPALKGDFYLVEAVANDSETGEPFVVYRKLYGDGGLWLRPLAMFLSPVDRAKYPDAAQEYRFELQEIPSAVTTDAVKQIHFYFGFTETFSDFLYCKSLHKAL